MYQLRAKILLFFELCKLILLLYDFLGRMIMKKTGVE